MEKGVEPFGVLKPATICRSRRYNTCRVEKGVEPFGVLKPLLPRKTTECPGTGGKGSRALRGVETMGGQGSAADAWVEKGVEPFGVLKPLALAAGRGAGSGGKGSRALRGVETRRTRRQG